MNASAQTTPNQMPGAEVLRLGELVNYQPGAVVSRALVKRPTGTVTAFAFDAGQGLSEHAAAFDALVQMIEGEADWTIAGKSFRLASGEAILLPANQTHGVTAVTPFKMLLTMIRS